MATLLLILIYIAFIGLGIPDSLFGAAWPAIYAELHLPVSWASFVTVLISSGTIVSSLLAAWLVRRFGTGRITAVSTLLTAAGLFGFSVSGSMAALCLSAIPLGLGAGSIDAALNAYVSLHYRAPQMNFLHCFYGIGVSLSPFLMSLALADGSWRGGYRTVFWCQAAIALLTVASLPLWKRVQSAGDRGHAEGSRPVGLLPLLRSPKVRMACLVFFGSCAMEYTCGAWGSTYLVQIRGVAVDAAARMITFYYVGMAVGRFLAGLLSLWLNSRRLVRLGQGVTLAAIVLLLLPLPTAISGVALFLIGMGNSPIFPNMLHLTPIHFGRDAAQAAMSLQMAAAYVGILAAPALFGVLAQQVGTAPFPFYLLAAYAAMVAGSLGLRRALRPKDR